MDVAKRLTGFALRSWSGEVIRQGVGFCSFTLVGTESWASFSQLAFEQKLFSQLALDQKVLDLESQKSERETETDALGPLPLIIEEEPEEESSFDITKLAGIVEASVAKSNFFENRVLIFCRQGSYGTLPTENE